MLTKLQRAGLPLLFVLGGIAAVVYGVMHHKVPVLEEHESEETIMVPDFSSRPPAFPGMNPMDGPPTFVKKKVQKKSWDPIDLTEPALNRDATIGGIVFNDKKELQRTYTGKPPSLCPT